MSLADPDLVLKCIYKITGELRWAQLSDPEG